MRLRLGLLQDSAAIEKQVARAAAEAQAKKVKHETPTVKTEAQMKADEAAAAKEKDGSGNKVKPLSLPKPKIRPLSEAKAIDSGATFVSEGFLLLVGVSLILLENWRTKRREMSRREDVAERISELEESEKVSRKALVELEREILRLRGKNGKATGQRILPKEVWELEEKESNQNKPQGWLSWIGQLARFRSDTVEAENSESEKPSVDKVNKAQDEEPPPRLSVKSILHLDSPSSTQASQQT